MHSDLEKIISFSFSCSSGNGGQNVNRRSTKATLTVSIVDLALSEEVEARFRSLAGSKINSENILSISCQEERKQAQNKKRCLEKLCTLLLQAAKLPEERKESSRTQGSIERRLASKKRQALLKKSRRELD